MDNSEIFAGSPAKVSDTCSIASSDSNQDQSGNGAIKSRSKARRMRRQKRGSELLAADGKSTKKKKLHVFEAKMKTQLCKHWQKGFCNKSTDCIFAHGHHELRMHESKNQSHFLQMPMQGYPGYPPYGYPAGYMEHPPPPNRPPFQQSHLGYGYPHGGYGQMLNSAPLHTMPTGVSMNYPTAPPSVSMGALAYPSMQPAMQPPQPGYGGQYFDPSAYEQQQSQQQQQQQNGMFPSATYTPQQQQGASLAHSPLKQIGMHPSSYAAQRAAANPVPMGHMATPSPLAVSAESFSYSQQGNPQQQLNGNNGPFYPSQSMFPSEPVAQSVGSTGSGRQQNLFSSSASPANKTSSHTWAPPSAGNTPQQQQATPLSNAQLAQQQQLHLQQQRLNIASPSTEDARLPEEELLLTSSPYAARSSIEGPPPAWFPNPVAAPVPAADGQQQWVLEGQVGLELTPSYLEQVNTSMRGSVMLQQQQQQQQQLNKK